MDKRFSNLEKRLMSLAGLPELEWSNALPHISERRLKEGETLEARLENSSLVYIESGLFKSCHRDENGSEFISRFFAENDIFISDLIRPNTEIPLFSFQAVEASHVIIIEHDFFSGSTSSLSYWENLSRKIMKHLYLEAEAKAQRLLLYNADQHFKIFMDEYAAIAKRIPRYLIAGYLGISPVSLSRIVNRSEVAARARKA